MAAKPRLSIVLSCYTKSPWFAETLESLLAGYHMRDTEIILCDDASPLSGGEGVTAREYAAKYPDLIRTFRNEERCGIARSYNRLLEEAKGEFFMPFDSDDIFVPFDVDKSMDFLDANRDHGATYGKKRLFSTKRGDHFEVHGGPHSLFSMNVGPRINHNAMIFRTSDVREAGGYLETKLGIETAMADIYLWTRLCTRKKLVFIDEIRSFYRVHDRQYSKVQKETYKGEYAYVGEKLEEEFPELAHSLRNFKPVKINDGNRAVVQMLLGRIFSQVVDVNMRLAILDTAVRTMPDDHGAYEIRAQMFLAHNMPQDALRDAYQIHLCKEGSLSHYGCATNLAAKASEMIWKNEASFRTRNREFMKKYFELTPEQKALLDKTVAHARKFDPEYMEWQTVE